MAGSNPPPSSGQPAAQRVPIRQQVDLQFPTFEGLVTEVAANLSTSGMFIQTTNPVPVGTEFSFALRIEEWSPIQGRASVVWIRGKAEGSERPAGMGIRFLRLDAQSRRMIRWIVDKNLQEGGRPYDPEKVPAGATRVVKATATPAGEPRLQPSAGSELTRSIAQEQDVSPEAIASRSQRRRRLLILAIVALAAYWGHYLWRQSRAPAPTRESVTPAPTLQVEPPTLGDSAAAPTREARSTPEAPPASSEHELTAVVQAWATAWTNRNRDALLQLYSPAFAPEGTDRASWQKVVSQQIESASFIRVAVSGLEISIEGPDAATATFYYSYRSDLSDETRRKQLRMHKVDGHWLIREESFLD